MGTMDLKESIRLSVSLKGKLYTYFRMASVNI